MEVRENLIKLCEKISDGHYKITPDCAEYKVFEKWITDEQIAVLLAIKGVLKPNFVGGIARRAGLSKEKALELLHELAELGLVVQVLVPKLGLEIYLQPLYTPGVFEFLLLNEPFCRAHPEIACAFEQHATTSQTEHAMNTPMGAGIMRVIPVEAAIPAEAQQIDKERVSYYIEKNADHLCALPCQCRRVRTEGITKGVTGGVPGGVGCVAASFASTVASGVPSSFIPTFFSQQSSSSFSRATMSSPGRRVSNV